MPAFNSTELLKNIKFNQLNINNGEISGDLISGGCISSFSSTGISDQSTKTSLIIKDNKIEVDIIETKRIDGDVQLLGNLHVTGELTIEKLKVKELISDRTYDKMYLEFQPIDISVNPNGSGLIWKGRDYTKLFVFKNNPDRFFSTENFDLPPEKSYKIDGVDVLNKNTLGSTIRKSSLREVGTLHSLNVTGDVNLSEFVHLSSDQQRISINTDQPVGTITISDIEQDVIMNIDVDNGRARIGTFNNRPFDLTVGDLSLVTLEPKGVLTFGNEYKEDITTRVWGKVGINVKNPEADLDIRGSMKISGKLFMVDNSPPNKGNYKRGDIVWNENPQTNSPIGWVCVVSGSPGKWLQFGIIQE